MSLKLLKSAAAEDLYARWNVLGRDQKRVELPHKVTGAAVFCDDVVLPNMRYAKLLGSPYAHARIKSLNTSRAEALAGVEAVVTYKDLEPMGIVQANPPYDILNPTLFFVGDIVAAVAARDECIAEEALDLIEVAYEELPFTLTGEESADPSAPALHENVTSGNICRPVYKAAAGDLESGFNEADVVIEKSYRVPAIKHMWVEQHTSVAYWQYDELNVWLTSKAGGGRHATSIGEYLNLPQNKINVRHAFLGADFGGKNTVRYAVLAAMLARKANAPVKIRTNVKQCLTTGHVLDPGLPTAQWKFGAKKDGTPTALDLRLTCGQGRAAHVNIGLRNVGDSLFTAYRCKNRSYVTKPYFTNTVDHGAVRAYGSQAGAFIVETVINEMAEKLGIDPVEYRTKFAMQAGDIVLMAQHQQLAGGSAPRLVQQLAEEVGWKDKWKGWGIPSETHGAKRRGVGICIAQHECGWDAQVRQVGRGSVLIKINPDGHIDISSNNPEVGSGVDTSMCMVAAEELGVDLSYVRKVTVNSTGSPNSMGSFASSGLGTNVYAALRAAEDVHNKILNGASILLQAQPAELTLDLKNKGVYVTAAPDKNASLLDIANVIGGGVLYGLGSSSPPAKAPDGMKDAVTGRSLTERGIFAAFVELDVDMETGKVDIVDAMVAFQSGMVLNPLIMSGQAIGGLVHGISQLIGEGVIYDEVTGTPLNSSICDYPVWGAADIDPEKLHALADVDPEDAPLFPFKAKGAAEGIYAAIWAAIPLAVHNATGIWLREMTCRPEKILKELGKADFPVTKGVI